MKKTKRPQTKLTNPDNTGVQLTDQPTLKWSFDLLFPAFVLAGVLYHWVALNYAIVTGTESENWPSTRGTVEDVQIVQHSQNRTTPRGGSSTTSNYYEAIVEYRYTVGGKLYTNNMANAGGGWFCGTHDEAKRKTDSITSLSSIRVFYDPSDPSKSVLERGVPERDFMGMLVTVPAIGGAMGMAFNGFSKKRIPDGKRRVRLSIVTGIGVAIVAGIMQWAAFELLI